MNMGTNYDQIQAIQKEVEREAAFVSVLTDEIGKVIVGQRYMVERLLIAMLADGHVLIEGVPGLAKTLTVSSLARTVRADFKRIQFTPDLLPADLIGTMIYNPGDQSFKARMGPIFANIILADEINRAPAKVQSALLEAMQERQVTLGDTTFKLPEPFLVLATQNPIEQEGTYPLPEAQVDRFMLKLLVTYPKREEERLILDRMTEGEPPSAAPVIKTDAILKARKVVRSIYVDEKIKEYVLNLIIATRNPESAGLDWAPLIQYGASPRASIYLVAAAKGHAFLHGRGYVTPEDIKAIGPDILRHRIIVSYEAEAEDTTSDDLVRKLFDAVEVP
jgi:MoxR-like ATPase